MLNSVREWRKSIADFFPSYSGMTVLDHQPRDGIRTQATVFLLQ